MRTLKTTLIGLLLFGFLSTGVLTTNGQTTTVLLSADFNDGQIPAGWLNIDQDGLSNHPSSGITAQGWFVGKFITQSSDSSQIVAQSSSWLDNFAPGNRDWLITTPVTIPDTGFYLKWKSAPAQVGLYEDGYTVLISTTDTALSSFTDTVIHHRQNINDDPTQFSDGVPHTMFEPNPDTTQGYDFGLLMPHEFRLDDYVGQTIYVAFLHDSDDDFILAIDDVIIEGPDTTTPPTAIAQISQPVNKVEIFPNPVLNEMNITFNLESQSKVMLKVYDVTGKLMIKENAGSLPAGANNYQLDVSELENGSYILAIVADGVKTETRFVVNK